MSTEAAAILNEVVLKQDEKYAPFENYKDSQAEWLPKIPSHWDMKRLRFAVEFPKKWETRNLAQETLVSFVPMEAVGEYGGLDLSATKPLEDVLNGYTYFADGDVIVAKITPCFENGKGAIASDLVNGIGFGTTELYVFRSTTELDTEYLFYLTIGDHFRKLGAGEMYGAGGQKRVPEDFIRDLRHPIPPLSEQRAIATFLDVETSRIDALIKKKERLIELIHEKRTALISHAVTKGINPGVRLKTSAVEWLDHVPEHWRVLPLRRVIKKFVDYRGKTPSKCESGIPLITASAVRNNRVDHTRAPDFVSQETYDNWMVRGFPAVGDIVFTTEGATFGETGRIVDDSVALAQRLILFKTDPGRITDGFLFYHFLSEFGRCEQWSNVTGTTVFGIRSEKLKATNVIVPPLDEQNAIEQHIENETRPFDAVQSKITLAVQRLREYRTALISAAVTGKIDVRISSRSKGRTETMLEDEG